MKPSTSTPRRNSRSLRVSGSTVRTMPERQPMCWTVRFDAQRPLDSIEVGGFGAEIVGRPGGMDVVVQLPYGQHTLLHARPSGATIFGGPAFLPVFARRHGSRVALSNRAAQLMAAG